MKITELLIVPCLVLMTLACTSHKKEPSMQGLQFPPKPEPRSYVCYRASTPVNIDGVPDEKSWEAVQWTDYFVDIEGNARPAPAYKTRAKMLWDDEFLYVAAELEDPHVWATLKQRDTVIFYDNDFEIFIDPDQDTHAYYELEFNALGTAWDLLLLKPYRDGGPAVNGWDVRGLKVSANINGTINKPDDIDRGWTIEIAIPLESLKECNGGNLPAPGDQWKIDFSRVEWRTVIGNGRYRKEINPLTGKAYPENNWVWSPQGLINMHMPEMWGYLQFSGIQAGAGTESFVPDPDADIRWALRKIYYAESKYFQENGFYTSELKDLGLEGKDFPGTGIPVISSTRNSYESFLPVNGIQGWTIFNDGRIVDLQKTGKK